MFAREDLGFSFLKGIGSHTSSVPLLFQEAHNLSRLITSDVNFDHSIKVVSTRVLHCKITTFSFVIMCIWWRNTLRYANIHLLVLVL